MTIPFISNCLSFFGRPKQDYAKPRAMRPAVSAALSTKTKLPAAKVIAAEKPERLATTSFSASVPRATHFPDGSPIPSSNEMMLAHQNAVLREQLGLKVGSTPTRAAVTFRASRGTPSRALSLPAAPTAAPVAAAKPVVKQAARAPRLSLIDKINAAMGRLSRSAETLVRARQRRAAAERAKLSGLALTRVAIREQLAKKGVPGHVPQEEIDQTRQAAAPAAPLLRALAKERSLHLAEAREEFAKLRREAAAVEDDAAFRNLAILAKATELLKVQESNLEVILRQITAWEGGDRGSGNMPFGFLLFVDRLNAVRVTSLPTLALEALWKAASSRDPKRMRSRSPRLWYCCSIFWKSSTSRLSWLTDSLSGFASSSLLMLSRSLSEASLAFEYCS
ncbi:MAG: hypothetical protein WDO13_06200 [Verrucomicrobiota bacterium]